MSGFTFDEVGMMAKSFVSKMKRAYEKQYEIPKLRLQVNTMRFILK
jgi:hypothetical protein